jgi:hypothetical protein
VAVAAGVLGMAAGSWVIPLTIAIVHDGLGGFAQVRVEAWVFAHPPNWIDPNSDRIAHGTIEATSAILALIAGAFAAKRGLKLAQYLIVKKLRWMTQEEVEKARRKEKQLF